MLNQTAEYPGRPTLAPPGNPPPEWSHATRTLHLTDNAPALALQRAARHVGELGVKHEGQQHE